LVANTGLSASGGQEAAWLSVDPFFVHPAMPTGGPAITSLQFAQKAVVLRDGKILLVRKSAEDPNQPGKWDLPGGRIKAGEGVDSHLTREVLEETGLRVMPGRLIDLWSWVMLSDGEDVHVLAVSRYCLPDPADAVPACREPDDYLAEQCWFTLDEVRDLDIIPSRSRTINMCWRS
jgi:8-oxo-dGTP pyrophosphatase MutT (NUDIX family)